MHWSGKPRRTCCSGCKYKGIHSGECTRVQRHQGRSPSPRHRSIKRKRRHDSDCTGLSDGQQAIQTPMPKPRHSSHGTGPSYGQQPIPKKMPKRAKISRNGVEEHIVLCEGVLMDSILQDRTMKMIADGYTLYFTGGVGNKKRHYNVKSATRDVEKRLKQMDPGGRQHRVIDVSREMRCYDGYERFEGSARKEDVYQGTRNHKDFAKISCDVVNASWKKRVVLVYCKGGNHRSVALVRHTADDTLYHHGWASIQVDIATASYECLSFAVDSLIPCAFMR